jgi:hypothetical protein
VSGLADPYLKLNWAKRHLEALDAELESFHKTNPCRFSREDDLKGNRHVLRVELPDIPDPICLMCGDAFYCMRSCLDQLVWRLAKTTVVIPDGTQFPIFGKWGDREIKKFSRWLNGVPGDAVAIIRELQPANSSAPPEAHPLWRINAMCNLDKHRRIPANGCQVDIRLPNARRGGVTYETFDSGAVLSVPLSRKRELDLDPKVSFQVVFGDATAKVRMGPRDIRDVYKFVADRVLPRFVRFFPQ